MAKTIDDLTLGYLAIDGEFINLAELKWCLQVQAESQPPPTLANVLVSEGYLSTRDVEYLHMMHAAKLEKVDSSPDPLLMAPELSIERIERAIMARLGRALRSGQFGKFKILGQIGRGGMGVVVRATEGSDPEPVALKLLLGSGTATVKDIERFKKEAAIMIQIRHDNIVQIFDVGREKGLDYIVMELIDGDSLADVLEERRPTVRETLSIGVDMTKALQFIHNRGIFHRDLKPANIMVEGSGRAVLMDFGLAVFDKFEVQVRRVGSVGTPQYQPPEQAQVGGKFGAIGPHSDVYGLAATLYHLLTGDPPFNGTDRAEIRRMVLTLKPPRPAELNRHVPAEVDRVIMKALAKKPENRYRTPREFGKALERVSEKLSTQPPSQKRRWFR
ncbi:serine/threonine-protein kinase [Planctomycetota bacterium]